MSFKYARVESERRFLVRALPEGIVQVSDISDRYLVNTRLRLREMTTDGATVRKLGQKVRLEGSARIAHTTLYLDASEWDVLLALPARVLTKRRHLVERDGFRAAIDEHLDGSLVAEIDGGDVPPTDPPTWLDVIREITDDEAWTGGALAR